MIRIITLLLGICFFLSGFSVLANESSSELQPAALIDVASRFRYTLVIELENGKLHIFEQNGSDNFQLAKTMDISIGKSGYGKEIEGDNKTPVGVYRITSYLTNEQLDDFYGNAAYPVNYPNAWDKVKKRTGYGIWIHAEPIGFTEKTRPLRDSNGCVVLSNNDIDRLQPYLDIGHTYVVLTPKMELASVSEIKQQREAINQRISQWRQAWESLETSSYLDFYSKKFDNLEKNWVEWSAYKKRINSNKRFIKVALSDLSVYRYPGEENLLWVEFYQTYNSSNFTSLGWKRQLWRLEDDSEWRIIYEGGG